MSHLAEDLTVLADDALDSIVRTVRIVWRLHRRLLLQRIHILEGHLTVCEKFLRKFLIHNELTLAVADSDSVEIAHCKAVEPR